MCVNCKSSGGCECTGGSALAMCSCDLGDHCAVCNHDAVANVARKLDAHEEILSPDGFARGLE